MPNATSQNDKRAGGLFATMPDEGLPGGDMSSCMTIMQEDGYDEDAAARICQSLKEEEKSDNGNVDELRDALQRGKGLIADVGVDILSGVDVPAIDSQWVKFKSDDGDYDWRVSSRLVTKDEDDKRIAYAAAMIPRELDKEGDVVPTPTVENAAHKFLTEDGGVDTDHSLIEGDGDVVESWVLKQERDFNLPDGGSETYPAGTWMVGIRWAKDAWDRIQSGDLQGLSIYGMAESVPLGKSVDKQVDVPFPDDAQLLYPTREQAFDVAVEMGLADDGDDMESATHIHSMDGEEMYMPAGSHSEFEDAEKNIDDPEFSEGDAVSWDWQGDTVSGRVSAVQESATVSGQEITGDEGEAVYVIHEYDEDVEAYRRDNVAKPQSSLSESQRDLPPVSEENFASVDGSGETLNTAAEEKDIQDSNMTDTTDADDGDGPTLKDLQQQVEQLKAEVDGGETAKSDLGDIIQSYADEISQLDDIDRAAVDIEDDLRAAIQADEKEADEQEGDTDEADKEVGIDTLVDLVAESDAVEASEDEIVDAMQPLISGDMEDDGMGEAKYNDDGGDDSDAAETEKAESANLAKGYAGRDSAAKAAADSSTKSEELSYQELAEQHTQD